MSTAEKLRQEGIQKGIQEGIQRGIQEGLQKGAYSTYCNLIRNMKKITFLIRKLPG